MSKKKKKTVRKKVVNKNVVNKKKLSEFIFSNELEQQIRRIFRSQIIPIEQQLESLAELLFNIKANVVVANSLLERKKIFSRDEFFSEFELYQKEENGGVNKDGSMDGSVVVSLYNCSNSE